MKSASISANQKGFQLRERFRIQYSMYSKHKASCVPMLSTYTRTMYIGYDFPTQRMITEWWPTTERTTWGKSVKKARRWDVKIEGKNGSEKKNLLHYKPKSMPMPCHAVRMHLYWYMMRVFLNIHGVTEVCQGLIQRGYIDSNMSMRTLNYKKIYQKSQEKK